jgi:hypothetical protein
MEKPNLRIRRAFPRGFPEGAAMVRVPVLVFLVIVMADVLACLWLMYVFAWRTRPRDVPDLHERSARTAENAVRGVLVPYRRNEREADCDVCRPRAGGEHGDTAGVHDRRS